MCLLAANELCSVRCFTLHEQDGESISAGVQLCAEDMDFAVRIYCTASVQFGQEAAAEKGKEQNVYYETSEWGYGKWVGSVLGFVALHCIVGDDVLVMMLYLKCLVTLLNYRLRYINNFIYLSIYLRLRLRDGRDLWIIC